MERPQEKMAWSSRQAAFRSRFRRAFKRCSCFQVERDVLLLGVFVESVEESFHEIGSFQARQNDLLIHTK